MNGNLDRIVISKGGSIVVPDVIDVKYIKEHRDMIEPRISRGEKFAYILGGGKFARIYQTAARDIDGELTDEDIDWLGIDITRTNARLIMLAFKKYSLPRVISNPTERIDLSYPVIVAGGWEPGCSTDYDAVLLARNLGSKKIVNLTNIDHVYDKDPKESNDAKPIREIKWKDFRKLLPEKFSSGHNYPFDPKASELAQGLGLEVAVMDGRNLTNLNNYLDGKDFVGTRIY